MSKPQKYSQSKDYLVKENYYQKNSEQGFVYSTSEKMLTTLGLENGQSVDAELHQNLLKGFNPKNGNKLAKNAGDEERRTGIDMTTSAPKFFSMLAEYHKSTNEKKYNDLIKAHDRANYKMMMEATKYIESRIYDETGQRVEVKADILFSSFRHDITRESLDGYFDPQIHTHNFVYNLVNVKDLKTGETKIMSLHNEILYKQKMYLGQFYRNELASELRDLGFELEKTNAKEGFFDIAGASEEQKSTFSLRSSEIESKLEELREKYPSMSETKLKELANNQFKRSKKEVNRDDIFAQNFERLREVGIDEALIAEIESSKHSTKPGRQHIMIAIERAAEVITENNSLFTIEEILRETMKQLVNSGITRDDIMPYIIKSKDIILLDDNVYSTQKIIDIESEVISKINQEIGNLDDNDERVSLLLANENISLTLGQQNSINTILESKKQFIAIQGDAGSGKTFSMQILNKVYGDEIEFVGLAPTGKAAIGLQEDSGINSRTLARFFIDEAMREEKTEEESENRKPRVLIVDESGMIDSPSMHKLFKIAEENGDKVVLIGDTKQLQSVGAGRIFADLQEFGIETAFVDENMRQKTEELRDAVSLIKEKNADKAFEKIENNVTELEDKSELLDKIIEDFEGDEIVIASKNTDRRILNLKLRQKLGMKGTKNTILQAVNTGATERYSHLNYEIGDFVIKSKSKMRILEKDKNRNILIVEKMTKKGSEPLEIDLNNKEAVDKLQIFRKKEMEFDIGEKIVFTKPYENKKEGINFKNGQTGIIKNIDGYNYTIESGNDTFTMDVRECGYMDYGYCLTDHKSQGMSIPKIKVLLDNNMANLNSFYVQVTRAKDKVELYTENKDLIKQKIMEEQMKGSTLKYTQNKKGKTDEKLDAKREVRDNISRDGENKSKVDSDRERKQVDSDTTAIDAAISEFESSIKELESRINNRIDTGLDHTNKKAIIFPDLFEPKKTSPRKSPKLK